MDSIVTASERETYGIMRKPRDASYAHDAKTRSGEAAMVIIVTASERETHDPMIIIVFAEHLALQLR